MTLALRLGRTYNELLDTLSPNELVYWIAYDKLSPIGDVRQDWNAGIITAKIHNVNRGKNQLCVKPTDCVPDYIALSTPTKPQTGQDHADTLRRIVISHGGTIG